MTEDIPAPSKGKRAEYVWKKEGDIKQDELTPLAEKIIREELKNYAIYKNVQRSQKETQKNDEKPIELGNETFE